MVFMARMSLLSANSMEIEQDQKVVTQDTISLSDELRVWWNNRHPSLRDQSNDWRRQPRPRTLTVPETLKEEGIASIRSCMYGCVLYLAHITNPLNPDSQSPAIHEVIRVILDIVMETPEGYGLEMGHYFAIFMAGITVFNNYEIEDLLRQKLKADTNVGIYVSLSWR
jgi:hypothetical protein